MQIPDKKALDKLKTDLTEREMATYLATRFGSNDPFFSATAINYMATALEAARTLSDLYDAIGEDAVRYLLNGDYVPVPYEVYTYLEMFWKGEGVTKDEGYVVNNWLSARPKKGE